MSLFDLGFNVQSMASSNHKSQKRTLHACETSPERQSPLLKEERPLDNLEICDDVNARQDDTSTFVELQKWQTANI